MKDYPKISDAEWQVIDVLWSKAPLSASEIIERVSQNNDWSPKTIHTLISRLVKKDAIKIVKSSPCYEYVPNVSQADIRIDETKSFLNKIYKGSIQLMLSTFVKEENLTEEEIEELRKILSNKDK